MTWIAELACSKQQHRAFACRYSRRLHRQGDIPSRAEEAPIGAGEQPARQSAARRISTGVIPRAGSRRRRYWAKRARRSCTQIAPHQSFEITHGQEAAHGSGAGVAGIAAITRQRRAAWPRSRHARAGSLNSEKHDKTGEIFSRPDFQTTPWVRGVPMVDSKQRMGPQECDAHRPGAESSVFAGGGGGKKPGTRGKGWQQQCVRPRDQPAGQENPARAPPAGRRGPENAAEDSRRKTCANPGEGYQFRSTPAALAPRPQPVIGKRPAAGIAIIVKNGGCSGGVAPHNQPSRVFPPRPVAQEDRGETPSLDQPLAPAHGRDLITIPRGRRQARQRRQAASGFFPAVAQLGRGSSHERGIPPSTASGLKTSRRTSHGADRDSRRIFDGPHQIAGKSQGRRRLSCALVAHSPPTATVEKKLAPGAGHG